jgi:glyoxylase-like metal-dependent hydrolase (beta-lactamase superfamily II)
VVTGVLFSGDILYDGPLVEDSYHAKAADYVRSMERLRTLVEQPGVELLVALDPHLPRGLATEVALSGCKAPPARCMGLGRRADAGDEDARRYGRDPA